MESLRNFAASSPAILLATKSAITTNLFILDKSNKAQHARHKWLTVQSQMRDRSSIEIFAIYKEIR